MGEEALPCHDVLKRVLDGGDGPGCEHGYGPRMLGTVQIRLDAISSRNARSSGKRVMHKRSPQVTSPAIRDIVDGNFAEKVLERVLQQAVRTVVTGLVEVEPLASTVPDTKEEKIERVVRHEFKAELKGPRSERPRKRGEDCLRLRDDAVVYGRPLAR